MSSVVDGRRNSGTARVARELISELSKDETIAQYLVHFETSDDPIYFLNGINEVKVPLKTFFAAKRFFSLALYLFSKKKRFFGATEPKIDIIHWHVGRVYPFFWLIPAKKNIVTLHDAGNYILPGVSTKWTRMFDFTLRLWQKHISAIIVVSEDAKKNLIQYSSFPPNRIFIAYPGSNFASVTPTRPNFVGSNFGRFYVCISRWQPHKNVENLVRAYGELVKKVDSPPRLVLIGKSVNGHTLPQELIDQFELGKHINVHSDLSDSEIAWLFDHAEANIFPSLHEGFGLSVLEGMTRGCPGVVHSGTATAEVVGETGIKVDMKSVSSLCLVLKDLGEGKFDLKHFSNTARDRSTKFTWENSASMVKQIYVKSLGEDDE